VSGDAAPPPPGPQLVWRPVAAPRSFPPLTASMAGQTVAGQSGGGRKRRGHKRGRWGSSGGDPTVPPRSFAPGDVQDVTSGVSSPLTSDSGDRPVSGGRPRCIINRSNSISRREDELSRALVVSAFGNCLDSSAESIRATIAGRFEIEGDRLVLHHFGPSSFLLFLPDEEMATRVYNGGQPIIAASHRLHVRRWSRFLQSTASSLQSLVEVELRGIPAHAWEVGTAEQLLNRYCGIGGVHPDSAWRRDVFRVAAWSSSPDHIPAGIDLEIVEPVVAGDDPETGKRSLVYPVDVSVSPFDRSPAADDPPSPPPPADDNRRRRRWRRRSGLSAGLPPAVEPSCAAPARVPVHSRLGPAHSRADCSGSGAPIDGVAPQHPPPSGGGGPEEPPINASAAVEPAACAVDPVAARSSGVCSPSPKASGTFVPADDAPAETVFFNTASPANLVGSPASVTKADVEGTVVTCDQRRFPPRAYLPPAVEQRRAAGTRHDTQLRQRSARDSSPCGFCGSGC